MEDNGLSASAEYELLNPTTLQITLVNTSVAPFGGGESDMVLSSLNFDLGGTTITGGSVALGPGSSVVSRSDDIWTSAPSPDPAARTAAQKRRTRMVVALRNVMAASPTKGRAAAEDPATGQSTPSPPAEGGMAARSPLYRICSTRFHYLI